MKILVIDDSRFQVNQITKLLNKHGFETQHANNGKVALETLNSENFKAILCDLLMPEMDGFVFLETVKKENINIPVIILSSNIQKAARDRCKELGAKHFLSKPLTDEQIENHLKPILKEETGQTA